jgi:hypothetical protein
VRALRLARVISKKVDSALGSPSRVEATKRFSADPSRTVQSHSGGFCVLNQVFTFPNQFNCSLN